MIKKLRYLCTLLLIAVASAAWGEEESVTFSEQGYSNAQEITSYTGTNFSITFDKGTNNNAPKYYTTGTAIRLYGSNTFTISSENTLTKVVLSFGSSDGSNEITADEGSYDNGTWTGSAKSITFTIGGTTGNRRLSGLTVTYTPAVSNKVAKPVVSGITPFYPSTEVSITCGTDGAIIQYSTDGTTWSNYNEPFTITETTTVYAKATKEGLTDSEVASKTFTKATVMTIAEAREAIDAGTGTSGVYVEGIISQIDSYNAQYGSITYWISEDGTTTNQFEVYGGLNLNNSQFTSIDDVVLGAEVVVFGNIKKYNDIYEFDKNNYLVSYVAPTISVAAPVFSPEAGIYTESQNVTITCETEGATIYYTVDGEEPTKASTQYTAAIEVSKTTTIKAVAYVGEVSSRVETATYEIQDPNAPGMSADNPYTVAQALAANPASSVYVKGIVSAVKEVSTEHGNATYNISDDGTTTNEMIVYRGKYLENANFTSEDQIKIGDEVVVTGNLVVYNAANQLAQGNYLISLERPETPVTITAPSFEPNGGEFEAGTTVTVTINVPEDENVDYVEYSFDKNAWTEYDTETTVITITETTTIYARSVGTNGRYSEVVSATYTIKAETPAEDVVIVAEDKTTFLFNTEGNEWGFPVGSDNKAVEEKSFTANGKTIILAGSTGNGYYYSAPTSAEKYLLIGKEGAYLTLPAFDFEVGKIEVKGAANASPNVNQNIYVGEEAVSTETTGAKNVTNTYVIDADYRAAGNVYTLKVTNNYNTQISQIIVHKATGAEKADPQLRFSAATATATLGSEFAAPTLSYVDGFDGTGTVVYESSDERVATVDAEGNVTLVAAGETIIKATSAETDNYLPGEAFYTLTVKEPAVVGSDKYQLVTDASTLKAGDEILIAYVGDDGATVMGEQKDNNRAGVAATINNDNTITPMSDAQVVTLEEGFYFNVGIGYLYAASSTKNYLKTETEKDDNAKATIAIAQNEETGAVESTIIFQGKNTNKVMRFNPNNGKPLFACYASNSTTGSLPQIYRKVTSTETLLGDVNGDKKVDVADVTALVNLLLNESVSHNPTDHPAANLDEDEDLDADDVRALVEKILSEE